MAQPKGMMRVLIADADVRVRQALRALIEEDPSVGAIDEASSAMEVLAANGETDLSVIVLELSIPEPEDGLALIRILSQQKRPVIAMSLQSGLQAAALRAGACAFVDKGAPPERVLTCIHLACRRNGTPLDG